MTGQRFVRFDRLLGMHDLDQLDLVELVLADHAAHVAPARTGFRTEARRVADELERQAFGGEDFVAHDIGHRHFGGRDQVKRILVAAQHLEQVFLEFRQLTGAVQAGGVDQVRRVQLGVTVLLGVRIEHELGKRAMQAGEAALEQRETGTGDLGSSGKIELAELFTDVGVILDRKIEDARRTPALDLDIAALVAADRHRFVGNVRQGRQDTVEAFQQLAQACLGSLQLVADRADLRHHAGSIAALALDHADLLGEAVAHGLQILGAGLQRLAFGFERLEFGKVDRLAALGEAFGHGVEIGAELLDVEHD